MLSWVLEIDTTAAWPQCKGLALALPRLARAEYRIIESLGRREAEPGPCRNLDLFTSSRVAAYASLEFALTEYSKTCQAQRTLVLELADYQLVELGER